MGNEVNGVTGFGYLTKTLQDKGIDVKEDEALKIVESAFCDSDEIAPEKLNSAFCEAYDISKEDSAFLDAVNSVALLDGGTKTLSLNDLTKEYKELQTVNVGKLDITQESYENIKKEIENEIEQKKQELSDTKKDRGWLTSAGNAISGLFGGGDKKTESEIEKLEKAYQTLEISPAKLAVVYKTVMGKELDLNIVKEVQEANDFVDSLSDEEKLSVVESLQAQLDEVQSSFDDTKEHNGLFSKGWDKFKNWTGVGASSNKTQTELDNAYRQLELAKDNPSELVKAYKNITGSELTPAEFEKLYSGETSLMSDSKVASKVVSYTDGQEMFTDVFADVVVGFVCASEAVALGVAGFFTGGAAWAAAPGALLATRTAMGAVMKPAIKGLDAKTGGREYTFKDGLYDVATGAVNGATAGLSKGMASVMSTGVGKVVGLPFAQRLIGSSFGQAVSKVAASKAGSVAVGFASRSAERAVDGFIGAGADGVTRAVLDGRYDDILTDAWEYGKAGAAGSVVLGGVMDVAGAGVHKFSGLSSASDEIGENGGKKSFIKEKLKQTKIGKRVMDDWETAKANYLNKVDIQSPDAKVMSEMSDYYSKVKTLVENEDALTKGLNSLVDVMDEVSGMSSDIAIDLSKMSDEFAQSINKQSETVQNLLERLAKGEDVSSAVDDVIQKGLDINDFINEKTVGNLDAFSSKMDELAAVSEKYNATVSEFVESIEKNKDEITSLFSDAKAIASEVPDTNAFKQLGEMPDRVKNVLGDVEKDMTQLSTQYESACAKIQAGDIEEGLLELDSYYKNMSQTQSKFEAISKEAQNTAEKAGLVDTASTLSERVKTISTKEGFSELSSTQKAQSIVEESNIAFSKFIQTMSSDETLPEGVRSFFKEFTSNCTVSRTLEEAQTLADEIYGKGKYTLKKSYGAGTIGETYLVSDASGQEFVMKMLKNGVSEQKFEADRAMFTKYIDEFVTDAADKEYKMKLINGLFDSWEKELDYGAEAMGAKNMAAGAKRFDVAQTVEVGSKNGANISLVMEKADGVGLDTLIDLLDFKNQHPKDYMTVSVLNAEGKEMNPWIKNKSTIDANEWIKNTDAYSEQLPVAYQKAQNEQSMFLSKDGVKTAHADPHPGNVFVDFDTATNTPKITYIDTGNVITRTNAEVLSDISLSLNMLIGNSEGIATSLLDNATLPSGMTQKAAIEQVSSLLDERLYKAGINLKDVNYTQATMMGILSDLNIIPDATNSNLLKANLQRIKTSREIFAVTGTEANKSIDIKDMLTGIKQSFKVDPKGTMKTIKPIVKWAFKNKDQTLITFFQMMFKESDFTTEAAKAVS